MPDTAYLIDVYSLVFQVFHAIPEMTSPRGLPTNAVFGFTRDILNILTQKRPTHLICATDPPGPVEREQWFPAYKGERSPTPEDLVPQFPLVSETIDAFGIPRLEFPGWEADDVIATLVDQAVARGIEVCIVSNDKDLRQLLGPNVRIYQVRKELYLGPAELLADWGVRPEQVVDYQALVGDSVDNVPGVPLIGPKKASSLLQQWGTLDEVLAHADQAPGAKLRENLKTFADQARLSRRLVTLKRDLPLEFDWEQARIGRWNVARLQEMFRQFGFRRFADEVRLLDAGSSVPALPVESAGAQPVAAPAEPKKRRQTTLFADEHTGNPLEPAGSQPSFEPALEPTAHRTEEAAEASTTAAPADSRGQLVRRPLHFTVVDSSESLDQLVHELRDKREFCLDLETTHLDPLQADIVGWAISWEPNRGYYIVVRGPAGERLLSPEVVVQALRLILEASDLRLANQNLKYDLLVLRRAGVRVTGIGMDPMVGSYLLEAGARSHGLDELARRYLSHEMIPISSLIGKGKLQKRMDEVPVRLVAEYAVEDAEVAWTLAQQIATQLKEEGLWDLYWELERPLIEVLVDMQERGIRVEVEQLQVQSAEVGKRLDALRAEIHESAGREFNIDSPRQLSQILFQELNLPVLKKTQTGASTDQEVLEQLAMLHPLPRLLLEHRTLTKLKGTYLDALPQLVNPASGKIHCSFNQVVAATGRLSSSEPNLQNIPVRTPEGRLVRRAFVPAEPGWLLLCADYSQIELRMLAHFSEDEALTAAFREGLDVHMAVAAEVFGIDPLQVDSAQRRIAKAVNFGVIYGQSPFGLATQLQIPKETAAKFIDDYFGKYAGVDRYLETLLQECGKTGYATTILGRRRAIQGIRGLPGKGRQRNLPERTAINTVIQGSAADLIKQAMLRVNQRLSESRFETRLLLQIHDELVFETPAESVTELAALVREEMVGAMSLRVPLQVDVTAGPNWLDQDDIS